MANITILISEKPADISSATTLFQLRDTYKPDADIVVYNGAPAFEDRSLKPGDAVVFIRRGEMPSHEELQALMAARHTPGVHAVLQRSTVAIGGLGGLGSSIAIALARIGIGKLILADFDVVEPSNLNRQQYFIDQIGMLKATALTETLARINPFVAVNAHALRLTPDTIPMLFEEAHVIVEAFDREEEKAMLVETVLTRLPSIPVVAASGLAGHDSANTIRTQQMAKNFYVCGDLASKAEPGCGLMAPRVGVAAHHQSNAILRILLGESL